MKVGTHCRVHSGVSVFRRKSRRGRNGIFFILQIVPCDLFLTSVKSRVSFRVSVSDDGGDMFQHSGELGEKFNSRFGVKGRELLVKH